MTPKSAASDFHVHIYDDMIVPTSKLSTQYKESDKFFFFFFFLFLSIKILKIYVINNYNKYYLPYYLHEYASRIYNYNEKK